LGFKLKKLGGLVFREKIAVRAKTVPKIKRLSYCLEVLPVEEWK
jgi:hypothetical protein